jgi:hypothetical protein
MYTSKEVYSGSSLLAGLNFKSGSGLYKNFTRMSPSEFEFLINLIGEKNLEKNTAFRKAISVQEMLALTHLSTGLFMSFPNSSHASGFLILLKCIECFGSPYYFFSFIKFDKFYDTFPSPLHFTITKTLKKPHGTCVLHHSSRQKH